jgi:hypothetical protein
LIFSSFLLPNKSDKNEVFISTGLLGSIRSTTPNTSRAKHFSEKQQFGRKCGREIFVEEESKLLSNFACLAEMCAQVSLKSLMYI